MKSSNYLWSIKIDAFLHDPAHKSLVLGTLWKHEEAAQMIAESVGIKGTLHVKGSPIEHADHIAAAADRNRYLRESSAYWTERENILLTHPLGGEPWKLSERLPPSNQEIAREIARKLGNLLNQAPHQDKKRLYLWLWGRYFQEAGKEIPETGKYFSLLPADTRQPDHSLQQHLSVTAALAAALSGGVKPAFLFFGIGPVQEFIAAARRTADLWAGSWLLSFLLWKGIEAITEEAGPDAILFPSLRGQPLAERWLAQALGENYEKVEALRIASFPNRFVAILPYAPHQNLSAEKLAQKAEQAIRETWQVIASETLELLKSEAAWESFADSHTQNLWDRQVESFPEVYWSVLPWPGEPEKDEYEQTVELWKKLTNASPEEESFAHKLNWANWGNGYDKLYMLAERLYGSRKALRDQGLYGAEVGEMSGLMPGYPALRPAEGVARDFWQKVGENLHQKHIYLIQPGGRERLDALSTIKRFLPQIVGRSAVLPQEVGRLTFPSNSEVAAAPFKKAVIEGLEGTNAEEVKKALLSFLDELHKAKLLERLSYGKPALPYWRKNYEKVAGKTERWGELLRLEGSWLYDAHWERSYLAREGIVIEESRRQAIQKALRGLYRAVGKRPSPYYAVLYMDGDHMGRWLSGTHPQMPKLRQVVHPNIQDRESIPGDLPRPVTPAYHAFISEALGHFSRYFVPLIVEEESYGALVYAGGDDVLALLPMETAIEAALRLRAAFSGFLRWEQGGWCIDWKHQTGYVESEAAVWSTMGPKATASVGLAFAHHRMPLRAALEGARRAEALAKGPYGRDHLTVLILKRSGEPVEAALRWLHENASPVEHFLKVAKGLTTEGISLRIGRLFGEVAGGLVDKEMARAELRRLLTRRQPAPSDALRKEILDFHDKLEELYPERAPEAFTAWIQVADFLQRGEL